jgi:hypothetical protein
LKTAGPVSFMDDFAKSFTEHQSLSPL